MNLHTSNMYGKSEMRRTDWLIFGEGLACGELEECAKMTGLRRAGNVLYK
jgi:hypothetical protein